MSLLITYWQFKLVPTLPTIRVKVNRAKKKAYPHVFNAFKISRP